MAPAPWRWACPDPGRDPEGGCTLTVGLQADPTALDAQKQSLTAIWHVVEHIYEGTVGIGADLAPYPLLAESWEVSEDGLTVTFKIREGVLFHDGSTLTAEDVAFTYTRLLDPATASTNASDLLGVAAVEFNSGASTEIPGLVVVDPQTVELTLTAPDASLLVVLAESSLGIVSKAFTEANRQRSFGQAPMAPACSASSSTSRTRRSPLEKHTEYWQEGLPYLDGMEMLIVPTDVARTASLVQGRPISSSTRRWPMFRRSRATRKASPSPVIWNTNIRYMSFNFDIEPLGNPLVRQADRHGDRGSWPDRRLGRVRLRTAVGTIFPPDLWAAAPIEPAPG
ncbi:MAG: ABC transporter substrate-binding protein [Thermomicrobiales bacterium]